jgi:hypothetical protein|tara:strand:+ start:584 stop:751 length:168 start_codon:yes stop_codon:yes gene_type:complete
MRESDKLLVKSNKKMCDEGMNAYDSFLKKGNTPRQANKHASKICNDLGMKASFSK